MIKPSILLIESQKNVAEQLSRSLSQLGYQNIRIAPTNGQALKALQKNSPDIVLMDVGQEDDSRTLKAARQIVHDREIPLVYVSGDEKKPTGFTAHLENAGECILRTSDPYQIKAAIETVIHRHDIEAQLHQTRTQFHAILNNINDAVIITDHDGRIVSFNRHAQILFGQSKISPAGQPLHEYIRLKELNESGKTIDPLRQTGQMSEDLIQNREARICLPDHSTFPIEFSVAKYETGMALIFRRISEASRLEEQKNSESKYHSILENAIDGIVLLDSIGTIYDVNESLCRMLGIPREKLIGENSLNLAKKLLRGKTLSAGVSCLKNMLNGENIKPYQLNYNNRIFEIRTPNARGELGFTLIFRDITERIHQENQIRTSLQEKEVLLQEIHHRVKNNLQIISSLLHLQSFQFTDENILDCIQQSQNRIRTMAILHEQLYNTDDFAYVDFEYYVRTIIRHLLNQFPSIAGRVSIHMDIEKCTIGIENAVYCGLIINELASNAMKHAFPGNREGNMAISLRQITDRKNSYELIARNNGVRLPENLDVINASTLGLRLVRLLSEKQMRGKLSFEREPETAFKIFFREM